MSDFDKLVLRAKGKERHSFGTKSSRFGYMPQANRATAGPGQYDVVKSEGSVRESASRFSLGLGRGNMNKIFVDEIQREAKKKHNSPGAGRYQMP